MSAFPVEPGDFPDPFVLVSGGRYYAYGTNGRGSNVQVMSSPDLATWTRQGDALPVLPSWAEAGNTWSPAVLARGDTFVLFYVTRFRRCGRQAISVATADQPEGPFRDVSTAPLIFQRRFGGSIDPSPYVDVDGQAYLFWKADANAVGRRVSLWAQPLASSGQTLLDRPTRLLVQDSEWENPLIEAPALVMNGGIYYLFYSANWWMSENYGIGYATARNVLGPYVKATRSGPWLGSGRVVAGPGGQEFFVDADGVLRMAYHGWQPGTVGYPRGARSLRIARVTFDDGPTIV